MEDSVGDGGGDAEGEADDADDEGGGPQAAARGSVAVVPSLTPVQISTSQTVYRVNLLLG